MSDEPKKRGRKKNVPTQEPVVPIEPVLPKKRGRKPKGGKIIEEAGKESSNEEVISNVILHLKCSTQEIDNTGSIGTTGSCIGTFFFRPRFLGSSLI